MHSLLIALALLAAPPDWLGQHHSRDSKGLFETGIGEDATEASVDAIGRLAFVFDAYVQALNKDYAEGAKKPGEGSAAAAEPMSFAQLNLGKHVEVMAQRKPATAPKGASWAVRIRLADGERKVELKLFREPGQDDLKNAFLEVARSGLGFSDVLADLEKGNIFVDSFCDEAQARCYARAIMDTARKPTDRGSFSASVAEAQPMPEWVMKGSGVAGGEKGRAFYAVGVAEGIRNQALRQDTAGKSAGAELRKLADTFVSAVLKELGTTLPPVDDLENPVWLLLLSPPIVDHFTDGEKRGYALAKLDFDKLVGALESRGLAKEKLGPAADKVFRQMEGP